MLSVPGKCSVEWWVNGEQWTGKNVEGSDRDSSEIRSWHLPNTSQMEYFLDHKLPVKVAGNHT
jgi:hypothetical protein